MPPSIGSPLLWGGFTIFVLIMLALDLGIFNKSVHEVHYREALIWTLVWIGLAALFNTGIYLSFGPQRGLEFLTGYLIEYALSVDNIFIFLLIFRYFSVPAPFQHRILFWGILGALVMRLTFVLLGTALLYRFSWLVFVFGVIVIVAGIKMLRGKEVEVHPDRNLILRLFRRFVPTTSQDFGSRLMLRRDGKLYATPLLLVLIVVEATDLAFATDSIPAILAVTRDSFVIYSSNIFAILGLRSLYFLLAKAMNELKSLKVGLGLVLVFVGLKMLLSKYWEVPIGISLAVVGTLLSGSVIISLLRRPAASAPSKGKRVE